MNYDLIISDEYVRECGDYIEKQGQRVEVFLSEYIEILQEVTSDAFKLGKACVAIERFANVACGLQSVVSETSRMAKNATDTFVAEIDQADFYTY
jgi:hypothetical protein